MDEITDPQLRTIARLLETPELFRSWIRGHELSFIIGKSSSNEECPLVRFLRASGAPEAQVDLAYAHAGLPYSTPRRPLPYWARHFVNKLDESKNGTTQSVTADEALSILNDIVPPAPQEDPMPAETLAPEPPLDPWQAYLAARKRLAHLRLEAAIIREDVDTLAAKALDKNREYIEKLAEVRQAEVARANAHDALPVADKSVLGVSLDV